MKDKIEDLRQHLFATIEGLLDEENPMELDRAKTIAKVADTMIESAKVEVSFLEVVGAIKGSGFIPDQPRLPKPLGQNGSA